MPNQILSILLSGMQSTLKRIFHAFFKYWHLKETMNSLLETLSHFDCPMWYGPILCNL